jgi:hypothetical protein
MVSFPSPASTAPTARRGPAGAAARRHAERRHAACDRTLPRQFLRIDSWDLALDTPLTPHFMAWELISVDVREAPPLRSFPRYVPCALLLLASALELFRLEVGTYVHTLRRTAATARPGMR